MQGRDASGPVVPVLALALDPPVNASEGTSERVIQGQLRCMHVQL